MPNNIPPEFKAIIMHYKITNFYFVWFMGIGFVRHSSTINMRGDIIATEYSFYLPFIEIKIERF